MTKAEIEGYMRDPSEGARINYLTQIGDLGESTAAYLNLVEDVVPQLQEESAGIRKEAIVTLGKWGETGAAASDRVVSMLRCPELEVVRAALDALGFMRLHAQHHASAIVPFMKHEAENMRASAIMTLGAIQATQYVNEIAGNLDDGSTEIVHSCLVALTCIGEPAKSATPQVAKLLSAAEHETRRFALMFFDKMRDPQLCLQNKVTLCKCIVDDEFVVREAAVRIFSSLHEEGAPLAEALAKLTVNSSGVGKCSAATALGCIGEKAAPHAATLAKLLADDFADEVSLMLAASAVIAKPKGYMRRTKCAACVSLRMIGEEGWKFAVQVVELLNDPEREVRLYAVQTLGDMGAHGAQHEAEALALLEDHDIGVQASAIETVGQMGSALGGSSPEVTERVARKLKSRHPSIRNSAAGALGLMGAHAVKHADKLLKCFDDRMYMVRVSAIYALSKLGEPCQVHAGAIAKMTNGLSPRVRVAAMDALTQMGDRGAAYAEEVAEQLFDPEAGVRIGACQALGRFGEESVPFVNALNELQDDAFESVRDAAADAVDMIIEANREAEQQAIARAEFRSYAEQASLEE